MFGGQELGAESLGLKRAQGDQALKWVNAPHPAHPAVGNGSKGSGPGSGLASPPPDKYANPLKGECRRTGASRGLLVFPALRAPPSTRQGFLGPETTRCWTWWGKRLQQPVCGGLSVSLISKAAPSKTSSLTLRSHRRTFRVNQQTPVPGR